MWFSKFRDCRLKPELSSGTVFSRHERRQERERRGEKKGEKKKKRSARYRIDVRRQRARLLDINGSLRVSRPALSLSLRYSRRAGVRARARTATGVSRAARRLSLSVIVARYQRSSSLAPRGERAATGCRFHRRKTNVISRFSPRSEEQPNSAESISRNVNSWKRETSLTKFYPKKEDIVVVLKNIIEN